MRTMSRMCAYALVALVAGFPLVGSALDVNHFDIAPGEKHFVLVYGSDNLGRGTGQVDLFLSYAPTAYEGFSGLAWTDFSKNQFVLSLGAAYGLTDRIQIGAVVPYLLSQDSDVAGVSSSGLGDIHLEGKFHFFGGKDDWGSALVAFANLDTGEEDALMSDDANGFGALFIVDRNWCNHTYLAFNLGYVFEDDDQNLPLPNPVNIQGSWLAGIGYSYGFASGRTRLGVEVKARSSNGFFNHERTTPVELIGWAGLKVSEQTSVTFGAGAGLNEGYGAPDFRLFAGLKAGF